MGDEPAVAVERRTAASRSALDESVCRTAVPALCCDGRPFFWGVGWPSVGLECMFSTMSGLQVVIVSAVPDRADSLARGLREAGHQVAVLADAAQAGKAVQAGVHDAIVVDLRHPSLDRASLATSLSPAVPEGPPVPLDDVERRHIIATLQFTRGNKRRAAQLLGIARSTLIQKVRRYSLEAVATRRTT